MITEKTPDLINELIDRLKKDGEYQKHDRLYNALSFTIGVREMDLAFFERKKEAEEA